MSTSTPHPDYGIDLTLHDIGVTGRHRFESGYRIDVQGKSTVDAAVMKNRVRYDLDVQAYDLLRLKTPACPRILVVLLLPADESLWTTPTEDELILRRCAFWLSLRGKGRSSNRRAVRLSIPRMNVFSLEAVQTAMDRVKKGENL
jgi:hypothetical protein